MGAQERAIRGMREIRRPLLNHIMDARQVPKLFVDVKAIAHNEAVLNIEAHVISIEFHLTAGFLIQ